MPNLFHHLRIALRVLAARRALALARVTTVALVVSAVTAVFTVANATFLRPLPFPSASRLMLVYQQPPGTSGLAQSTSLIPVAFARVKDRAQSFELIEGELTGERAVAGDGEAESIPAARVTAGYFELLGGTTALGRTFTDREVLEDARVVVLSDGLWKRRFGGDPGVVGRLMLIDRQPHAIVGVLHAAFEPAFVRAEFWTPLNTRPMEQSAFTNIRTLARLKRDRTVEHARSELRSVYESIRPEVPAQMRTGFDMDLVDLRQAVFGARGPVLYMLLAAAAALALIAIANLANLTLADVLHRRADFAVRTALGGSRASIAAPEIAQAAILAFAGGAAGLAIASWLVPALLSLDPSSVFTATQLTIDWRIALCAFGAATVVMMLAVAVPVCRVAGATLAAGVAAGSRRSIGSVASTRMRLALVALQTALALVLLSSGAVVVMTLLRSARIDPGFDSRNVITAQLRLPQGTYPTPEARSAFIQQVLAHVRGSAGILSAGTTMNTFAAGGAFTTLIHIEGKPSPTGEPYLVQFRRISPGFFETLGVALVRGRLFDDRDLATGQPVAIVSRELADRFWPGEDPVGRQIRRGAAGAPPLVVIGVVAGVRDIALDQEPAPTFYVPVFQNNSAAVPVSLVVRTAADPARFVTTLKNAVWAVDPRQPLGNVITLDQFLVETLGPQRFRAILVATCGIVGLALAVIGTYGVTARSVSERRREIGIRLALGGTQRSVWWAMSRRSLDAVVIGAAAGAGTSTLASMALRSLLPETGGGGWILTLGASAILLAIAAVAAFTAARSAASLDPVAALRGE